MSKEVGVVAAAVRPVHSERQSDRLQRHMLAARYTQGGCFEIVEVPILKTQDGELLLRVEATSLCGTDVNIAWYGHRKLKTDQSVILGHAFVGTIEMVGRNVHGFEIGDRVGVVPNVGCGYCEFCGRGLTDLCPECSAFGINIDGSHTEYVRITAPAIDQGNIIPLAKHVPAIEAGLAAPLSSAVNGIRLAGIQSGDMVLIYGAGVRGLMHLMLALLSGASEVFVVDLDEARLDQAMDLGATDVFNLRMGSVIQLVMNKTGNRGMNVVITPVPVAGILAEAVKLLAPYGRLCLFGGLLAGSHPVTLDTDLIRERNLFVTGMSGGAAQDFRTARGLIATRRIDISKIISHVFSILELDRAFETALARPSLKIVLTTDISAVVQFNRA